MELNSFKKGKHESFCVQGRVSIKKKKYYELQTELGHPSEEITGAMGKTMNLQLTGTFITCKACTLGKAKKARVSKMAVAHLTVKDDRLFINISSLSTARH